MDETAGPEPGNAYNHELVPGREFKEIRYETRPVLDRAGTEVADLHSVWIWLDNPEQLN
jgi:hypothetical protein